MKHLCTGLVGFLFCVSSSLGALKAGATAKMYLGDDGLQVSVVDVTGGNGLKQKLLKISGIDTEIDGLVLLHEQVKSSEGYGLETIIHDQLFWTLRSSDSHWGGKDILLTLPEDVRKKHRVWYSKKDSEKIDKNALVAEYQEQLSAGRIKKVQLYSGNDLKPRTKRYFKDAVDGAKQACEAPIGTRINWDSVKPNHQKGLPIAALCRHVADSLINYCRESESNKAKVKKLQGITCSIGSNQELALKSNRLMWNVPASGTVDLKALNNKVSGIFR